MYIWKKGVMAGLLVGLGVAVYLHSSHKGITAAEVFNYALLAVSLAWAGALVGGVLDWARYRRSPFEPVFKERFHWHYRQGYWLRFAIVFSFAWVVFILFAAGLALAVGAKDDARAFFTIEGISLVVIFCFVFAFEGVIIGGIVDLFRRINKKKA